MVEDPVIETFTVEPETILPGETAELHWEVLHARELWITDEGGEVLVDAPVDSGRLNVAPLATTTYELVAHGEEGSEPASASVTLEVLDTGPPEILSFTADPDEVVGGDPVTLSWTTTGGDDVSIAVDDGESLDLGDVEPADGSVVVHPEESTTYTMTLGGPGGVDVAEAAVTVFPAPMVLEFSADPGWPVLSGTDVTVEWATSNAHAVTILADGEVILETTEDLDGSLELHVELLTELLIVASGALESEATSSLIVPVIPVINEFVADGLSVRPGDTVTFSWSTSGAQAVTIEGPEDLFYEAEGEEAAEGELATSVDVGGDFILTAVSGTLDDVARISIEVTDAPRVLSFSAVPDRITEGESVTVSWTVQAADSLSLHVSGLGEVDISTKDPDGDSIEILLNDVGDVELTLTATSATGETQAHLSVEVLAVPSVQGFAVLPTRVGAGESVELHWVTSNAYSVRLDKDGASLGIPSGQTSGSATDVVDADASYVLHAFNQVGHGVASEEVAVAIGEPEIVSFDAVPPQVAPGGGTTLSWRSEGGGSLSVTLGGSEVCQSTSVAEIADGSCVVTAPEELGHHLYTLEVENGAGSDAKDLSLLVSDGPIVVSFTASRDTLTTGEPVVLSWVVEDDVVGASPELVLEDDLGGIYDLAGRDPNQDQVAVVVEEAGDRTFTLTATTPETSPSDASVDVLAVAAPVIDAFQADPSSIDTEAGAVQPESTLSWEISHAVSLFLWELDEDGVPLVPALLEEDDPMLVAAGDFEVEPVATTSYRLMAQNSLGYEVASEVRVVVDDPFIASFIATPAEVVAGETVTLEWTTERASSVSLEPAVRQVSGGYQDISDAGERIDFRLSPQDARYVDIEFPEGFSFPYYGIDRTMVRISYFALVSFQFTNNIGWSSSAFPGGHNVRSPMIAAFWDYIRAGDESAPHAFYLFDSDDDGQLMRIQWSDFELASWGHSPSTLNIQMVLREDGRFEFHYGVMEGITSRVDGSDAGIGYDNDDGTEGFNLFYREVVPGGLNDTGFILNEPPLPVNGSTEVAPKVGTTYVLEATGDHGTDAASAPVTVHPAARIRFVTCSPAELQDGEGFTIEYEVTAATRVEVMDEEGVVICEDDLDPTQTVDLSCEVDGRPPGTYEYALEATSVMEHHKVRRHLEVEVYPLLEITSFEVDKQSVLVNEWVTFSWTSVGAEKVELFIDTSPNVLPEDADPDEGTFETLFHQTTDVRLRITGPGGRAREETITIFVNAARIDELSASETTISPGETVTLSWSTTNADTVVFEPGKTFGPILDIRDSADQVQFSGDDTGYDDIVFPDGFIFQYYEVDRTQVRMMTDGFLSFNPGASSHWTNTILPNPSTRSPVMAPFWDDLHLQGTGEGHHELFQGPGGAHLIIQWSGFQFSDFGADDNPTDLNFQVILHEDGTFEYRYGAMISENQARADGAHATAGYEDDHGEEGYMLFFETEMDGGLSNRGWHLDWRMDYGEVDPEGSIDVAPARTTTYTICATGLGWTECEDVTVVVEE